jgi:hypothetical protein
MLNIHNRILVQFSISGACKQSTNLWSNTIFEVLFTHDISGEAPYEKDDIQYGRGEFMSSWNLEVFQ